MNENNAAETVSKKERLYIGNLPFSVDGGYLKKFFQESLGEEAVLDAEVIVDKARGRSKGYGFVTFTSPEYAEKAVSLNGKEMESKDGSTRPISINPAHDKKANDSRGFKPRRYNDNYRGDRGYYPNDRNNRGGNGNGSGNGNRRRGNFSNSNGGGNRERSGSGGRGYKSSYNERDYLYS